MDKLPYKCWKRQSWRVSIWHELEQHFGIKVTRNFNDAVSFYLAGIHLSKPFKLDTQWICPTNFYVDATNDYFLAKRNEIVPLARQIYATSNQFLISLQTIFLLNNRDASTI